MTSYDNDQTLKFWGLTASFKSWLLTPLATYRWVTYFISPGLGFLISKVL